MQRLGEDARCEPTFAWLGAILGKHCSCYKHHCVSKQATEVQLTHPVVGRVVCCLLLRTSMAGDRLANGATLALHVCCMKASVLLIINSWVRSLYYFQSCKHVYFGVNSPVD